MQSLTDRPSEIPVETIATARQRATACALVVFGVARPEDEFFPGA